MLLATIDATVLISGLSLLILVAGPVGGGRRGKQRGIRHAVTGRRPREPRPTWAIAVSLSFDNPSALGSLSLCLVGLLPGAWADRVQH